MIPWSSPLEQYLSLRSEIDAALQKVCLSGHYILGQEVEAFEGEFAEYTGTRHAIGVANGTDALHLALAACGIGTGDQVITVAHTAVATVSAIERAGATPVLVDIEPDHFCIDPTKVEAAITPQTRAVIAVHLYGNPVDLDAIKVICGKHKLRLIEDCAQATGAKYRGKMVGGLADLGCFSFYPTKNLGAIGDGGMVVTQDPELAERVRILRQYGWKEKFISEVSGWNSRLDEMQASILRIKLRHLQAFNAARREIARRYREGLADMPLIQPIERPQGEHVFHLYVVRSKGRDRVLKELHRNGIGAGIHYPVPIHRQPAYSREFAQVRLPVTELAAREILSLPMYPELLTNNKLPSVIELVRKSCVVRDD